MHKKYKNKNNIMNKLETAILFFIKSDDDEYVSLLGTDLNEENNSWRIILPKTGEYEINKIPYSPILKMYLEQFVDKSKITNNTISDAILFLRDSLYVKVSDYDLFSFKLTEKGNYYVMNSELSRDTINKIGYIK